MSGLHLGIQKRGGTLVVTNLDSTDGTLINEKRLRPGAAVSVSPGSRITFGARIFCVGAQPPSAFTVSKVSAAEFPDLSGQSVSYAPVLQFPAGTTNPPHTHPRSAERLLLVDGSLRVGFVDTTNKLFTQTLQAGDMFVFPKGLVHFHHNADARNQALTISAFESAGAGTVSLPTTLFTTSIDDNILAKPFKIDVATIQALKAGPAPKP
ncbi:GERMIN-LIKE PROTEIN SUBFAMILY 3 MEMBER 3 [Salix purpurea]|uniref:Germin-like protein n=1 Tax=Salix purpurea TaxID=77065 RepID=A0A9Q1AC60_SALPP|nr:GERMIN-LIKE PROTEIN SUBFAMILY 3 MEMBER 3 [Salix purpurea]